MISPASTNPKVTDEGGPNVFRVIGRDDQQGTIAGDYLADNHSKSNIAIIHDGQAYGLGLAEFTKRQLNKRGVTEVMFDSYTPDQKDYKSIVDKLVNKKTDVLYAGGYLDRYWNYSASGQKGAAQSSLVFWRCAGECPVPVRRG